MARYAYERLYAQDNDFLRWEHSGLPMHVGGLQIFRSEPLENEYGGVDFDAIVQLTRSLLHRIPRYRQKLAFIPGRDHAVWVDDPHFNLGYHMRHTSLPRPGTDEQLKRLTARIMEQPLDRGRPLWETWVVEGLTDGRFALVSKVHHCMIDGASGVDLSQILLSPNPERRIRESPRFIPRPEPTPEELRRDELLYQLRAPLAGLAGLAARLGRSKEWLGDIADTARSVVDLSQWMTTPASDTPINGDIGPHRVVDWLAIPLDDVRAVRAALDCSVNDVVLASVTGALRRFMQRRQVDPAALDFRASTPVNVRSEGDHTMGNRVSSWVVRLPVGEPDPLERVRILREATRELKASSQALTLRSIQSLLEFLPFNVPSPTVGTVNTVVTNVPGPPMPLYLLGSEALAMVPLPPLLENLGLTVGVLSYAGQLHWGLNADYDRVPDLGDLALELRSSFAGLAEAAGVVSGGSAREGLRAVEPGDRGRSAGRKGDEAGISGAEREPVDAAV